MKKIKLLMVLVLGILLIPSTVLADEEVTSSNEDSKKVNIYFFRGEGCPHCEEAEEFFESIQEEYGEYFTVVDYETWYDKDNAELMKKVAEARDEEANGVPYIIIGNKSWNGYSSDYDDAIKEKIKEVYEQDPSDRYDIMKYVDKNAKPEKDYSSDVVALIIIILATAGIGTGIYFARKKTA